MKEKFDLENVNIPMMSDEGLLRVMEVYRKLYNQGKSYPNGYITNSVYLSTDRPQPKIKLHEFNNINNITVYYVEMISNLLNAMREDIINYGWSNYITQIQKQSGNSELMNYLNSKDIAKAINYPKDMLAIKIREGKINELPPLIQFLYNRNMFCDDHIGELETLPFIISKPVTDLEQKRGGRKSFRVYFNNPINKSGFHFNMIFLKKLIEQRIPYDNKYCYNVSADRKDKSIFYFPVDYLNDVTKILDDIQIQYPDLINQFGTPPIASAQHSYYGICHTGASLFTRAQTYNGYINGITELSFFIYFCRQLMYRSIFATMSKKEQEVVKKYATAAYNKELIDRVILHKKGNINSEESRIKKEIIEKYSNEIDYPLQPKDYRTILKQIASLSMYGDLLHTDVPICFNESFYDTPFGDEKKLKISK